MVSKRQLRNYLRFSPELVDKVERNNKQEIEKHKRMRASILGDKPRFWYSMVQKCESEIRRGEANLRRIEEVKQERNESMAYIPREDDEYRQKDKVPSRWERIKYRMIIGYNISGISLIGIVTLAAVLGIVFWHSLMFPYYSAQYAELYEAYAELYEIVYGVLPP